MAAGVPVNPGAILLVDADTFLKDFKQRMTEKIREYAESEFPQWRSKRVNKKGIYVDECTITLSPPWSMDLVLYVRDRILWRLLASNAVTWSWNEEMCCAVGENAQLSMFIAMPAQN